MVETAQARGKRAETRSSAPSVNTDEVARVAYELFLARGGVHGNDQQDWFEAERIVRQRQRSRAA